MRNLFLQFLLLPTLFAPSVVGAKSAVFFHRYERPLRMLPEKYGIYEIDLVLRRRLTMSVFPPLYREDRILDYDPDTRTWTLRDSDLFTECGANRTVLREDDTPLLQIETLASLIQHYGKHQRIVSINGISPGPTIVVPLGAEVAMRVRNELNVDAVTLHLHGMDKHNYWYTDGVAFIQQCPIDSESSHVYRFIADTPGTHWYHGHLMNDRADGLLGGFVVKREGDTYTDGSGTRLTPGREYLIMLQDWSSATSAEQWLCHTHTTMKWVGDGFDDSRFAWEGGRGGNTSGSLPSKTCFAPKRTHDGSNVGGSVPLAAILVGSNGWHNQTDLRRRPSSVPLSTYLIHRGENILLRFVNGGVSQGLMISVEEHKLLVVAADGARVKTKEVEALVIFPGERYDVLIRGKTRPSRQLYRIIIETMEYFNWDWTVTRPQVGLANLLYERTKSIIERDRQEEEDYDPDIVDFEHKNCTPTAKCRVLNCPFADFPPHMNFTCISAFELENAEPLAAVGDAEMLTQKRFHHFEYREIFANMNFDNHFNGWMFDTPSVMPYYYERKDGGGLARIAKLCDPIRCDRFKAHHWDGECACFFHYTFRVGEIVQMTIYNMGDKGTLGDGYSHPLHIHGTHFYWVRVGYAEYHAANATIRAMNADIPCTDVTKRCIDLRWTNASWADGNVPDMPVRPSFRDTINIPTGGYVTIRFRARNPGWWFAHCHLMLHNMGGTAFAFRVGDYDQIPEPPPHFPHSCGVYEQPELSVPDRSAAARPSTRAALLSLLVLWRFFTAVIAANISIGEYSLSIFIE